MTQNGQVKLSAEQQKAVIQKILEARKKREQAFSQNDLIFRVAGVSTLIGFILCLINVPAFRDQSLANGIYITSIQSLWWCLAGFLFNFITRRLFQKMTYEFFSRHLHPKAKFYKEQDRLDKLKTIIKQTYQGIFHLLVSVPLFIYFREQFWFPTVLGGCGSCQAIFQNYPQWPKTHSSLIQIYYQFQLGTYVYHILDLLLFDRERYLKKNFGQILFHHVNAFILIMSSLLYNFIPIGAMVFFIHDLSDSLRGFSRTIGDSSLCVKYPLFSQIWNYSYLGIWVYFRVFMFSLCLIDSMYNNIPSEDSQWRTVYVQHVSLIVLSFANFFIQCYWGILIFFGIKEEKLKNQYFVNELKKEQEKKTQ